MKILRVTKEQPSEQSLRLLAANDLVVDVVSPTLLSALTSMKIYKRAERDNPAIVVVSRQKDALAAISAKKLGTPESTKYKIIYLVEPNTPIPPVFHAPVVEGVDCWVFMSQRLHDLYPPTLKLKVVIPPVALDAIDLNRKALDTQKAKGKDDEADTQTLEAPVFDGVNELTIAWIGDIRDTERLKSVIAKVDEMGGRFAMRISGGGAARDVMPAVKFARTLKYADKVVWVGEDYDKAEEIAKCHAAVRSADDLTVIESEVLLSGREVLDVDDIPAFVDAPHRCILHPELTPEHQAQRLRAICLECRQATV